MPNFQDLQPETLHDNLPSFPASSPNDSTPPPQPTLTPQDQQALAKVFSFLTRDLSSAKLDNLAESIDRLWSLLNDSLTEQGKTNNLLYDLSKKEPVQVKTKIVEFPTRMDVRVQNPIEEVSVTRPTWFPDFQKLLTSFAASLDQRAFKSDAILVQILAELQNRSEQEPISPPATILRSKSKAYLLPETPTGTIDGDNKTFYLSSEVSYNTQLFLFLNGAYQTPTTDYVLSSNKLTYVLAPPVGSNHYALKFRP